MESIKCEICDKLENDSIIIRNIGTPEKDHTLCKEHFKIWENFPKDALHDLDNENDFYSEWEKLFKQFVKRNNKVKVICT